MRKTLQWFSALMLLATGSIQNLNAAGTLENENLAVHMSDNGAITFKDKIQDVDWGSGFVGWAYLSDGTKKVKAPLTSSECSITVYEDSMYFAFNGISGQGLKDDSFLMTGKLILHNNHFDVEITNIKTDLLLQDVEYPAHMISIKSGTENAYIAVPHLQGIMIPSRYDAGFMRYGQNIWDLIADQEKWYAFESGNLNMPWFGATIGQSSVMAIVETSSDCVLHMLGNHVVDYEGTPTEVNKKKQIGTRISSLTPIWKASKQQFAYKRKMRIELTDNGYVGMAKRYKALAKASGRYVTLKEKIERNPEFEKIIGAPDIKIYCYTNRLDSPYFRAWSEPVLNGYSKVNTTFEEVEQIANDLDDMGVEKCMLLLAGWNRMGYDREHVDMWPPAEPAGGVEGLKSACKVVKDKGYIFALHDNYDDFYPNAPTYDEKFILRNEDGSLHWGGVWDGGPCHITCPAMREELLNRNMALVQGSIPLNGYYFDVITNTSHYECFDERHPITRKEDLKHRKQLLKNITDRGLIIGGERGTDWAMPIVAFCEGLSGGGADYHRGIGYRTGLTIPLFYLVYRECVVGYWQHGTPYGREDHANHVLLDVLQGQPSSWSIEYDQWEDLKPIVKETYDLLGRLHEQTAHFAMTDHNILTENHMVQKSVLEDGTEIWVNFGITSYKNEVIHMPPKSFRIKAPGQKDIAGIVSREITYID